MATLANLIVKMGLDSDQYSRGIKDVKKETSGLGSFFRDAMSAATGFVIANTITRAAAAVGEVATAGVTFGREMANVNSIAQLTDQELTRLGDSVIAIARDPRIAQGPAELAAGLYNVYSSGFQADEGLNVLTISSMAATAGLTSSDTAARAVTAALNAYGLSGWDAARVSDVLFQTVNDGVITFDELANNLGNTLPIASSLGIQIEELGAAYALMTLKGVSASAAETQIASLMRSALAPTEALTNAVQAHGYESAEAMIRTEGLAGFLQFLGEVSGGSQSELLKLLGTQEAMNAATILGAEGAEAYTEELEKMLDASKDGGATQKALAKQMKSASYQFKQVRKNAEILATTIFRALEPSIARFARSIASVLNVLTTFAQYLIIVVQDGDYLNDFLTDLPRPLQGIAQFVGEVVSYLIAFGSAMLAAAQSGQGIKDLLGFLPQPLQRFERGLLLVADAVGDLVAAFRSGGLSELLQAIPGELGQIWEGLKAIGSVAISVVIDTAVSIAGWLWDHKDDIWDGIKDLIGWTTDAFTEAISLIVDGAVGLGGDLAEMASDFAGWIRKQLAWTGEKIVTVGKLILQADTSIQDVSGSSDRPARNFVQTVVDSIRTTGDLLDRAARWIVNTLYTGIGYAAGVAVAALFGAAALVVNAIIDNITDPKAWVSFPGKVSYIIQNGLGIAIGKILSYLVSGEALGSLWRGFEQGLVAAAATSPIDWAGIVWGAIDASLRLKDWAKGTVWVGVSLIAGILSGAITMWGLLSLWLSTRKTAAVLAIGIVIGTLKQKGVDLITGLFVGLVAKWESVYVWLVGRKTAAQNAVGSLLKTLLQTGKDLIAGFFAGAVDGWTIGGIYKWLKGRGADILSAIGDLSGLLYEVGVSVVQGMANGLYAGAGKIVDAAGYLVSLIPDGVKKLLGIGSPSKVMAELLYAVPQGMAKGMTSGRSLVSDAAGDLAGAAVVGASASMAAHGMAGGGASGGTSTTYGNIYITVDGAGDPQAVADRVFGVFQREMALHGGGA